MQEEIVRSIRGLEKAKILRLGYAVEYDFSPTHQVDAALETRLVDGLYFAGQINGTSGYEEAAGQGLIAGINAARRVQGLGRFTLTRDQAYIGVMIDDLITKTPTEPYRMFTSRAEYRLTLRSDNADTRLTMLGDSLGLATPERLRRLSEKTAAMQRAMEMLKSTRLAVGASGTMAYDFLRRPEIGWEQLREASGEKLAGLFADPQIAAVMAEVETEAKYAGYVAREKDAARRMHELEGKVIPANFAFERMGQLRAEARQALVKFRPQTVGQASRLEGITPKELTVLMLSLRG